MTLVTLLGFARAGSTVFWNVEHGVSTEPSRPVATSQSRRKLSLAIPGLLIALTAALAAFGGPMTAALHNTAAQTLDTQAYVQAVLGPAALPSRAER
jgi:multicomponent K+:H+ antiporter subunit D